MNFNVYFKLDIQELCPDIVIYIELESPATDEKINEVSELFAKIDEEIDMDYYNVAKENDSENKISVALDMNGCDDIPFEKMINSLNSIKGIKSVTII